MQLAKVIGTATSTVKHPSLEGWRMMIAQPLGADGKPDEFPYIAIDPIGAANGDTVLISSDSPYVRKMLGTNKTPVRFAVIGLVDA
ncbi:UNVERIFIED_CONTAM: hypothetical protein GTU68_049206 [Idotea baltica]|nr:hypothetical protein [Idotea baltica]